MILCIFLQLADKESFVVSPPTEDSALKESDPNHPFPKKTPITTKQQQRNHSKSVSFTDDSPLSPDSLSNVSTLTGTESVQHPFSDSDGDSDIENYRIKSILRGKTPLVYVKGEATPTKDSPASTVKTEKKNNIANKEEVTDEDQNLKTEFSDNAYMDSDDVVVPVDEVKDSDVEMSDVAKVDGSKKQNIKVEEEKNEEEKLLEHDNKESLNEGESPMKNETPLKSEIVSNNDTESNLTSDSDKAVETVKTAESDQSVGDLRGKNKEVVITKSKPLEERISQVTEGILNILSLFFI